MYGSGKRMFRNSKRTLSVAIGKSYVLKIAVAVISDKAFAHAA
jgi:hypothetical protein